MLEAILAFVLWLSPAPAVRAADDDTIVRKPGITVRGTVHPFGHVRRTLHRGRP